MWDTIPQIYSLPLEAESKVIYVGIIPTKRNTYHMTFISAPSRRSRFITSLRRSELVVATSRALCCVLAMSVPYALFVIETVLHP